MKKFVFVRRWPLFVWPILGVTVAMIISDTTDTSIIISAIIWASFGIATCLGKE